MHAKEVKINTAEWFKMYRCINVAHDDLQVKLKGMTTDQVKQGNYINVKGYKSIIEYIKFAMKSFSEGSQGDIVWTSRRNSKEIHRVKSNIKEVKIFKITD